MSEAGAWEMTDSDVRLHRRRMISYVSTFLKLKCISLVLHLLREREREKKFADL